MYNKKLENIVNKINKITIVKNGLKCDILLTDKWNNGQRTYYKRYDMKKKILIITTGGTLASSKGEEGLQPELNSTEIFAGMEGIMNYYEVEFLDFMSIDSSNMQPENWKKMAKVIYDAAERYQGMVVIHGTDTMAYTASMLSFMLQNIPIPVVLTGSQLSILNPIADAVENCRCAINMAGSGVPGIFVAFNRKIMLGTRASKVRTISFDAFESINYPYVGVINSNGLDINKYAVKNFRRTFRLQNSICTDVFLLKLIPGTKPEIFETLFQMGYRGIVIEAFGIGGLPFQGRGLVEAIRAILEKGMTIVVGSQCLYEGSNLSIYQTGQKVLKQGVLPCNDMTMEAAVTKLMWVLGQTVHKKEIEKLFLKNLAGEVTVSKNFRNDFY